MTRIMAALLVMLAGLASPAAAQNWLLRSNARPFRTSSAIPMPRSR